MRIWLAFLLASLPTAGWAETVFVKYRGMVDLAPFSCTGTVSSLVQRICYDARNSYMLIDLNGTFYHYCRIDQGTVNGLLTADSKGRFYNTSIKGRFDCRAGGIASF
jgi:hypothetical protein